MSSIKTTQIDGDVSIGRNVAIGGGTIIQGDAHIKGGVKVDGWLEAKNIKATNKGLFTTVEKLRAAYPLPHEGWWAIVGNTLPGSVYVVDGGKWTPTGEMGGSPTIESERYASSIAELEASMTTAKADISGHTEKIKTIEKQSSEQGIIVSQVSANSTQAKELVETLEERLTALIGNNATTAIDNFNEIIKFLAGVKDNDTLIALLAKVNERLTALEHNNNSAEAIQSVQHLVESLQGQLNTIVGESATTAIENFNEVKNFLAGLKDSDTLTALLAKVNERLNELERAKPSTDVLEVLEFDGFTDSAVTPQMESATGAFKVLFDATNKRFVAKINGQNNYSAGWFFEGEATSTDSDYQTRGQNPRPFAKKIYINRANNTLYRWNGEELVQIGGATSPIGNAELSPIIKTIGSPNYVKIKNFESLINSGNILMGKGVHQDGRIISTDLKATDFIAVSKGDVICIFIGQYTPRGLAVLAIYDENKTFIESFGAHKKLPSDGVITIQKNGYIALCTWENGIFSAVRFTTEKQSITDELDNVKKDLSTFEKLPYNKAQGITGFLRFNGEVSPDNGFFTTPKIEVDGSKNSSIFVDGTALNANLTGSNYPIFMQFDADNNILSFSPSGLKAGERFAKKEIALNPATKFVRGCCFGSAMSFYLKKIGVAQSNKKAINRNVNFVGMSIWWYDGKTTNNAERALQVGYQSLLREQFDFKADSGTNYCYSGFSLGGTTATDVNSIMNKSSEWKGEKGDIWTLDTIANEFKRNIPIGSISDYDNATGITTFYGALRAFSDKIKALSGENAIVICSNSLRHKDGSYTSVSANSRGHKLIDYEFAIMTVAKKNNWYFVDQFRSKVTDESLSITTLDGVHLNSFGYRLAVLPWIDVFNMVANAL